MYDRIYNLLLEASDEEIKYKRQRHLKRKIRKRRDQPYNNVDNLKTMVDKATMRPFGRQHQVDFDHVQTDNRTESLPADKADKKDRADHYRRRGMKVRTRKPSRKSTRKQIRKDITDTAARNRTDWTDIEGGYWTEGKPKKF